MFCSPCCIAHDVGFVLSCRLCMLGHGISNLRLTPRLQWLHFGEHSRSWRNTPATEAIWTSTDGAIAGDVPAVVTREPEESWVGMWRWCLRLVVSFQTRSWRLNAAIRLLTMDSHDRHNDESTDRPNALITNNSTHIDVPPPYQPARNFVCAIAASIHDSTRAPAGHSHTTCNV